MLQAQLGQALALQEHSQVLQELAAHRPAKTAQQAFTAQVAAALLCLVLLVAIVQVVVPLLAHVLLDTFAQPIAQPQFLVLRVLSVLLVAVLPLLAQLATSAQLAPAVLRHVLVVLIPPMLAVLLHPAKRAHQDTIVLLEV